MVDQLISKIIEKRNPTVMGLDPCLDYLPAKELDVAGVESNADAAELLFTFNKRLIDATYDIIPAVKLQSAYYEMYGWEGGKALADTARYASEKGMIVIIDGKRNDIGSTAAAYSSAYLGRTALANRKSERAYMGDFLTVNAYLGLDGIKPFAEDCLRYDRGLFVLVKTSNPSGGEFQDLVTADGRKLYEVVGDTVAQWGINHIGSYGYSDIGAVVGATYPEQLTQLRERLGSVFFLVPGYGAQGATAADLAGGFDHNGIGSVINASRSLMCAYKKHDCHHFESATRIEAKKMKTEILTALEEAGKLNY